MLYIQEDLRQIVVLNDALKIVDVNIVFGNKLFSYINLKNVKLYFLISY